MAKRACKARLPWYDVAFQADYLARYAHRSDDVASAELPFILKSLGLRRGARVLDLCCGAGRHSRALSQAGLQVIGIDRSMELLQSAAAHRDDTGAVVYVRADMRRLPLADGCLHGATSLFTSFGYFPTEKEDQQVLVEIFRVLRPGGRFVFDFFNSKQTLRSLVARSRREIPGAQALIEERRYDSRSRRLIKHVTFEGEKQPHRTESVRAYSSMELRVLFRRAGFRILARHGDLRGAEFNLNKSLRCVFIAEKPGSVAP